MNKETMQDVAEKLVKNSNKRKLKAVNDEAGTITIETVIEKDELRETHEIEVPATIEALQDSMSDSDIIKAASNELFESERDRIYKTAMLSEKEKEEEKAKTLDKLEQLKKKAETLGVDLSDLL